MPLAHKDRDAAMVHAIEWARDDRWIICFAAAVSGEWNTWAYMGEATPSGTQLDTVRFVLPGGEVTKFN